MAAGYQPPREVQGAIRKKIRAAGRAPASGRGRRYDARMSEREKMLAGELYDAEDAELSAMRLRCRELTHRLNLSPPGAAEERRAILAQLVARHGERFWVEPPFYCDYGAHLSVGDRVFINFNCVILDCARVTLGNDVLLAPGVQVYAATHPLDWRTRRTWLESAKPVTVGNDVWIGGGATLLPGVTVGDRSVIGAGSVVTRDVPDDCVVAGNPARVIRRLA